MASYYWLVNALISVQTVLVLQNFAHTDTRPCKISSEQKRTREYQNTNSHNGSQSLRLTLCSDVYLVYGFLNNFNNINYVVVA